ncbi:MAG: helix-turn-helix domain-containing protein [Eubacteriales bacterium]|nr:helix-turn-helix domain-containing protein [Eubacteriales bacterium]
MISNIIDFCQQFYASTFIPILYFQWPHAIQWSCPSVLKEMSTQNTALEEKIRFHKNPDYFITDSYAYFGFVNINDSPSKMDFVVLGPVYSTPISEETLRSFLRECQLIGESAEEMTHVLLNSPHVTFHQFLSMLSFIHLCINGEKIEISSHFNTQMDASVQKEISRQYSLRVYDSRETGESHNTWEFEQSLTDCISRGDLSRLQKVLKQQPSEFPIKTGTLSRNVLQHTRNLFIVTATLATRAAIQGGLDTEQAYQLSDLYIRECESTQNVDTLNSLTYTMVLDFTTRVKNRKLPLEGMSKEIFQCVQYISQRPNEQLLVDDVAAFIGRSRSYITKKFKEELGFDISSFIMRCKLEEAKSLLTYTDKPLSEISSYLCFSSQAYFQNVFKKKFGMTPMQYRKKTAG